MIDEPLLREKPTHNRRTVVSVLIFMALALFAFGTLSKSPSEAAVSSQKDVDQLKTSASSVTAPTQSTENFAPHLQGGTVTADRIERSPKIKGVSVFHRIQYPTIAAMNAAAQAAGKPPVKIAGGFIMYEDIKVTAYFDPANTAANYQDVGAVILGLDTSGQVSHMEKFITTNEANGAALKALQDEKAKEMKESSEMKFNAATEKANIFHPAKDPKPDEKSIEMMKTIMAPSGPLKTKGQFMFAITDPTRKGMRTVTDVRDANDKSHMPTKEQIKAWKWDDYRAWWVNAIENGYDIVYEGKEM